MKQLLATIKERALLILNPTTSSVLKDFDKLTKKLDKVAARQAKREKAHRDAAIQLQDIAATQVAIANQARAEANKALMMADRIEDFFGF